MLFIRPKDVNAVWATVARATADGQLGVAAKVAPYNPGTPYRDRLICIYTADFWDMDDIGKVLTNMVSLVLSEDCFDGMFRGIGIRGQSELLTYLSSTTSPSIACAARQRMFL